MSTKQKDTPQKIVIVALILCLVCSIFVSTAAVFLKKKTGF